MMLQPYHISPKPGGRVRPPLLSLPARRFWAYVATLNVAGSVLMWIGSAIGPPPYFMGIILLFPGDVIATAFAAFCLWLAPAGVSDVWNVLFLPVTIAINVLIISRIRRRYRAGRAGNRASNNSTKPH
jgi:hypothetical protein